MIQVRLCIVLFADLRDDQQFFIDHPGAQPISTAQVRAAAYSAPRTNTPLFSNHINSKAELTLGMVQGEELKRTIDSPAYIECSAKTQLVQIFCSVLKFQFIESF